MGHYIINNHVQTLKFNPRLPSYGKYIMSYDARDYDPMEH